MSLRDDLKIDAYALDHEWLKQPNLAYKIGEDLGNAIYDRDKKKDALELTVALLDADIRANPEKYGFESDKKLTEKAIEKTIITLDEYDKAQTAVLEANRHVALLTAAKTAIEHKKSALEALVKLAASNYFADPRISGDDKKAYEKQSHTAVADEINGGLADNERLVRRRKRNANGDTDTA